MTSPIHSLMPRQPVPELSVPLVGGGHWTLAEQTPHLFTMVVFYRGLHCPVCARYLRDLHSLLPEFTQRGVSIIALSSDTQERAERANANWHLDGLTLGYGLDLHVARHWGLYVSASIGVTSTGVEEPALFSEPGVFLVRPDRSLYYGSTQTMPFARPAFRDLLGAIDYAVTKNYPARGEVMAF
ncbi:peroxiredoxin [Deinococcus metalli]|uniref:Peroxiredoxin n=1 Tax=Deinococcus metalli TaxID=1141878 RepID=A0A7W8KJC6_9DEIO|nr:peroxiredoxin [Deinococcus metalli]